MGYANVSGSFRLAAEPELKQIGWVGKDLSQGFDFVC